MAKPASLSPYGGGARPRPYGAPPREGEATSYRLTRVK